MSDIIDNSTFVTGKPFEDFTDHQQQIFENIGLYNGKMIVTKYTRVDENGIPVSYRRCNFGCPVTSWHLGHDVVEPHSKIKGAGGLFAEPLKYGHYKSGFVNNEYVPREESFRAALLLQVNKEHLLWIDENGRELKASQFKVLDIIYTEEERAELFRALYHMVYEDKVPIELFTHIGRQAQSWDDVFRILRPIN